jgi:hypothetical protein
VILRALVRQYNRNPGANPDAIEKERESLSGMLIQLKTAQSVAGVAELHGAPLHEEANVEVWDEIINEPVLTGPANVLAIPGPPTDPTPSLPDSQPRQGPLEIEDQGIPLPSNLNVSNDHRQLELSHRIVQADHHLTRIRDLITEKSFQYSHVIRISPRKGVTTRSRASVKKLNMQIATHCRLYSQSRHALQS